MNTTSSFNELPLVDYKTNVGKIIEAKFSINKNVEYEISL